MTSELVRVDLPQYVPPPPWIPREKRVNHPDYDNNLKVFLPRAIALYRSDPSASLGFNIRGGVEHSCGLYVSRVLENSEADKLGLREGDQILSVNGVSFDNIDHTEAVKILKSNLRVEMTIRFFPYGYEKTYLEPRSPNSPR